MRLFLLVVLVSLPVTSSAALSPDDVSAIERALAGKTLSEKELVPRGFVKASGAKGDLNGDGIDDMALIVHRAAKKKRSKASPSGDESGGDDSDQLPQAVLVFLGEKSSKYALWKLGASHFIDSDPYFMDEDGVGLFQIKKGVLTIHSSVAMSMGGWGSGGCTQKWRNGSAGFQLIGITVIDINRSCACGSIRDTNLLTGLEIYTNDRDKDGEQMKKEKVTKTKGKPETILWEEFDYDKMCS